MDNLLGIKENFTHKLVDSIIEDLFRLSMN